MAGRPTRETNPSHAQGRAIYSALDAPILTISEVAQLFRVSTGTVERFLYRNGMPYIDLGTHHPGRRRKRLLRFEREAVLAWARSRAGSAFPAE